MSRGRIGTISADREEYEEQNPKRYYKNQTTGIVYGGSFHRSFIAFMTLPRMRTGRLSMSLFE